MTDRPASQGPWWAATGSSDAASTIFCGVCGDILTGDPADDPGGPRGSMCGACARAREFDQTIWELDLADPDAGLW